MKLIAIIERHFGNGNKDGLGGYIESNGYHFTMALAHKVNMEFLNSPVTLLPEEKAWVRGTCHTSGDLLFLKGMYDSDFPELNLETLCKNTLNDKDGYDGMIFKRWLVDYENRGYNIEWEDYI